MEVRLYHDKDTSAIVREETGYESWQTSKKNENDGAQSFVFSFTNCDRIS